MGGKRLYRSRKVKTEGKPHDRKELGKSETRKTFKCASIYISHICVSILCVIHIYTQSKYSMENMIKMQPHKCLCV